MTARSARPDVPLDQTWRLDDLFTSVEEWEAERAAIEQMIPEVSEFQGGWERARRFSWSVRKH